MPPWLNEALEKSQSFMPHGHCYLWLPGLLWMHVVSDALIGAAYVSISLILYLFVRRIRLPFSPVFIAFGLFIGLCGLTHFMAIWNVWNADYFASGLVKAATAAASVATAVGLFYIRPQIEAVVHTARLSETRRVQLESTNAELEALNRKISRLDEMKTQFFANVSHELRTPLALILGPAERLLGDPQLNDEQRRQLMNISANGKTLLKQVNDILDVAKLEEGQLQADYSRLDAAAWCRQIASQFELAAEHRRIQFQIEIPNRLDVESDANMLERILINLLSNAFKFTPDAGKIRVQLQDSAQTFHLQVEDSGPGIKPEQRDLIFDRFHQLDGAATRTHGGTGLGLAIVKDFAGILGGEVQVGSAAGGGAAFTVSLPKRAPTPVAAVKEWQPEDHQSQAMLDAVLHEVDTTSFNSNSQEIPAHQPGRASVLVVEDNQSLRQFIVSSLAEFYNLLSAADGRQGLEMARTWQPDLIITDIMMPKMSGDQMIEAIRQTPALNTVPILLLSAKADEELRVKLLSNGAQDYLTKPFSPHELLARAGNLVGVKQAGDALRQELASSSTNLDELARNLALSHRQLQVALETASVAREQAERASQVKSHFLALISHEMRTPLSVIHMNAQVLDRHRNSPPTETSHTRLDRLIRATQQLNTLIEGVLEYTRIESGRITAKRETIDLLALAQEVVEAGQLQLPSAQVTLELIEPTSPLPPFSTDPRLLRVVLNNIISNALKFTTEGVVSVHLHSSAATQIIEVRDTGIGIAAKDIPRIFLPFEQLEPIHRKSIPGVGLGLSLTKEIVEVLHGTVDVRSKPGAGSCFRISLPNSLTDPADQPRADNTEEPT